MRVVALVTVVLALAAGCGGDDDEVTARGDGGSSDATGPDAPADLATPERPPDIEGELTQVNAFEATTDGCVPADEAGGDDDVVSSEDPPVCTGDSDSLGTVLVEGSGNQIAFDVTSTTTLLRRQGGNLTAAGFDDLEQGARVRAWSSGPIAESYPARGTADAILILS